MVLVKTLPLSEWQGGDHTIYWDYTHEIAYGAVKQYDNQFEFRCNDRLDIMQWLEETSHRCTLYVNKGKYRARVEFETKDGAMEFKLRWC